MSEKRSLDWADITLGDCFWIDSGSAPGRQRDDAASVPLVGANGRIGSCKIANFGPGYVVGRVGAAGSITRVTERVWASDNALTLKPKAIIDGDFAHYLLQLAKPWELATATAQPLVTQSRLGSSRILLPSMREQVSISGVLASVDNAIHETEAIIAKLKAVKQGLLHDLLTRGIGANGELRPPQAQAPHLYKESPLGWIPKEWEFAPLVSKIDFPVGQVDPRRSPYRDWVLVAPDHIESGTGRLLSTASAAQQQAISGKYVFDAGDVVYSKIRPYLRKAILAPTSGLCSADMYPLRPRAGINGRYLLAVVLGHQFSRFSESVSMRSGFPKINRDEMSEFSTGWPDAEEQARIAGVLSEADAEQASAEEEHAKLQLLKVGLMDDLLTGRVRVNSLLATEPEGKGA